MQYKLKHKMLAKNMQSKSNEDRKTFSQKKKEEKTYEKENNVYFMFICCCRILYI